MSSMSAPRTLHLPAVQDRTKGHDYALPARLKLNEWALTGDWTMGREAIVLNKANGHIAYSLHGRDLHLVMGPSASGTSVRFRVLIDGQPANAAHGVDVDDPGNGTVTEPPAMPLPQAHWQNQ